MTVTLHYDLSYYCVRHRSRRLKKFIQKLVSFLYVNCVNALQSTLAENPVTTEWVKVFERCTQYTKAITFVEHSRHDACAVPQKARETMCTWMAAMGRTCMYRGIGIDWITHSAIKDYCTHSGDVQPSIHPSPSFQKHTA